MIFAQWPRFRTAPADLAPLALALLALLLSRSFTRHSADEMEESP